jgi:hypothetical protein
LFFAPSIPHRNKNRFDTFTWFKHSDDIPLGCVIFTDGSLLDGSLPKGCQSLGWAFVVIDADGELVAAAYGVPPEWVDTIQGAELWAVRVALLCAAFPSRLFTDCMSVKIGVGQPMEWARSSKRKLGRVFLIVAEQLEGTIDVVQWMPAHTNEDAIGRKQCSDGSVITDTMWRSNQLVDLMAKHAAESVRLGKQDRDWLIHRERQLCELCIFLGRLTHAANNHLLPDGKVVRDSDGTRRKRSKPKKPRVVLLRGFPGKPAHPSFQAVQLGTSPRRPVPGNAPSEWMDSWRRSCSHVKPNCNGSSGETRVKCALASVTAKQEAAFEVWWREGRSHALRPRDPAAPTAAERLEALRCRILGAAGRDRA